MQVLCVHCGRPLRLEENSYQNFAGMLRCTWCKQVFYVQTKNGHLVSADFTKPQGMVQKTEIEDFFKSFEEVKVTNNEVIENEEQNRKKLSFWSAPGLVGNRKPDVKPVEIAIKQYGPEPDTTDSIGATVKNGTDGIATPDTGKDTRKPSGRISKITAPIFNGLGVRESNSR